jgi:hypothetical protein
MEAKTMNNINVPKEYSSDQKPAVKKPRDIINESAKTVYFSTYSYTFT